MKNRNELAALFQGTGCELGVAAGAYSKQILTNPKVAKLYAIDRWNDHHGIKEHKLAAERLAVAGAGRCVALRMTFAEARPLFEVNSLDFVYVDGYAHTGQEEGKTLEEWWPLIKPGGILAGHDYCPRWQPTMDAVDDFVKKEGLKLEVTAGEEAFPSWWVIKPEIPPWHIDIDAKVILVGNGPSVLVGEKGGVIDSFDEVVRFNRFCLQGFEKHVGTRTTIWSTFGHGYVPGDAGQEPKRILFVYGDRGGPAVRAEELVRIPRDYYNATKTRMLALSKRRGEQLAATGMSSGFLVAIYMLDVLRIQKLTLAGFDHFRKEISGQHHYYNPKSYSRPPELDGDAEALVLADYVSAGRVTYL